MGSLLTREDIALLAVRPKALSAEAAQELAQELERLRPVAEAWLWLLEWQAEGGGRRSVNLRIGGEETSVTLHAREFDYARTYYGQSLSEAVHNAWMAQEEAK